MEIWLWFDKNHSVIAHPKTGKCAGNDFRQAFFVACHSDQFLSSGKYLQSSIIIRIGVTS